MSLGVAACGDEPASPEQGAPPAVEGETLPPPPPPIDDETEDGTDAQDGEMGEDGPVQSPAL
jgi:hypothetical protein